MIPTDPATRAAWARYQRENAEARHEYDRKPISSVAVCEGCGHTSAANVCRTCKDTP